MASNTGTPLVRLSLDTVGRLARNATVRGLAEFATQSPLAAGIVAEEMRHRVMRKLNEDFICPAELLQALDLFDCILAGKWLLSLLDPTITEVAHIDILVGDNQFMPFIQWLETNEVAHLREHLTHIPELTTGSYHYALVFACAKTTVRLIRSTKPNPYFLAAHYLSTHLMNYMAATHIVVAYPALTFHHTGILLEEGLPPHLRCNFTLGDRAAILRGTRCTMEDGCGAVYRWFNDPCSAVLAFALDAVVDGGIHWRLGGIGCNGDCEGGERLVEHDDDVV